MQERRDKQQAFRPPTHRWSHHTGAHLDGAARGLQRLAGVRGGLRVVGPGLPAVALEPHRLAQRGERLRVPARLRRAAGFS